MGKYQLERIFENYPSVSTKIYIVMAIVVLYDAAQCVSSIIRE